MIQISTDEVFGSLSKETATENSKFNLLCLPSDNFPLSDEDINQKNFEVSSEKLLKLLNKTKIYTLYIYVIG